MNYREGNRNLSTTKLNDATYTYKYAIPTSQRPRYASNVKTKQRMLHSDISTVDYTNHMGHVNTLRGQTAEVLVSDLAEYTRT